MSRPSDYEFISANTKAIEQEVSAMYTAITGQEVRASSPEKLFIQWITSALVQSYPVLSQSRLTICQRSIVMVHTNFFSLQANHCLHGIAAA